MRQCPCCGASIDAGAAECPDCGLAAGGFDGGEDIPSESGDGLLWPDCPDGLPERAAFLATAKNPADCALLQALLRSCGIPSDAQTPLKNQFTTVIFGGPILGADIYVPESRLEEAGAVLDSSHLNNNGG